MIILLPLVGCGGITYKSPAVRPQELHSGQKAIVITKASHKYKGFILSGEVPVGYRIARADTNYPELKTRHAYRSVDATSFTVWKQPYSIFMVEPGTYVVEDISYAVGDTTYSSTLDGLNPGDERFIYGGFSVKPGEIVYLGDLDINLRDQKQVKIGVVDNYDEAVKMFHKKHPDLASKPVNKKFFNPNGSLSQQ